MITIQLLIKKNKIKYQVSYEKFKNVDTKHKYNIM